jgi:hypothetical protein
MELNREQIIKALEFCAEHEYCASCPCDNECIGMESLMLDALALIKELTEELDDAKRDTIPKLKRSLERANAMGAEADRMVAELTEENERLRAACDKDISIVRVCRGSGKTEHLREVARIRMDAVKADTVRKMQELIFDRIDISVEGYSSEEVKSDVRDMVYQIAEEMLEGIE